MLMANHDHGSCRQEAPTATSRAQCLQPFASWSGNGPRGIVPIKHMWPIGWPPNPNHRTFSRHFLGSTAWFAADIPRVDVLDSSHRFVSHTHAVTCICVICDTICVYIFVQVTITLAVYITCLYLRVDLTSGSTFIKSVASALPNLVVLTTLLSQEHVRTIHF